MMLRLVLIALCFLPLVSRAESDLPFNQQVVFYNSLDEGRKACYQFIDLLDNLQMEEAAKLFFKDADTVMKVVKAYGDISKIRDKLGESVETVSLGEFSFSDDVRIIGLLHTYDEGFGFFEFQFTRYEGQWYMNNTNYLCRGKLSELIEAVPSRYIQPIK